MDIGEKCKSCYYCGEINGDTGYHTCNYILIENHRRGCEPGEKCTKWKKSEGRKKSTFGILHLGKV